MKKRVLTVALLWAAAILAISCAITALSVETAYAQEGQFYYIAYDAGGGILGDDAFTIYRKGDSFALPSARKDGYTFNGWIDEYGRAVSQITPTSAEDLNLRAVWLQNPLIEKDCPDIDKTYDGAYVSFGFKITVSSDIKSLAYQWYKDGEAVDGAQDGSMRVRDVRDSGAYGLSVIATAHDGRVSYATSDETIAVTIAKASYDMSGVSVRDAVCVADGKPHVPTLSGRLPDGLRAVCEDNYVESGVYRAEIRFEGDYDNYERVAPRYATLTINAASLLARTEGLTLTVAAEEGFYPGTYCKIVPRKPHDLPALPENVNLVGGVYEIAFYDKDGNLAEAPARLRVQATFESDAGGVLAIADGDYTDAKAGCDGGVWRFDLTPRQAFAFTDAAIGALNAQTPLEVMLGLGVAAGGEGIVFAGLSLAVRKKKKAPVGSGGLYAGAWSAFALRDQAILIVLAFAVLLFAVGIVYRLAQLIALRKEVRAAAPQSRAHDRPSDARALSAPRSAVLPAPYADELSVPAIAPRYLPMPDDEEDEEDGYPEYITDAQGARVMVRSRYSFMARLIQSGSAAQMRYGLIKNKLLSYKKVKSAVGWECERFRKGRKTVATLAIRGKTLKLRLPIDPDAFGRGKYRVEDCGGNKKYESVPALLRVKSDGACRFALKLIESAARGMQLKEGAVRADDYRMPYEDRNALLSRGLIKYETLSSRPDGECVRLDIGSMIRAEITRDEADTALDDDCARALTNTEHGADREGERRAAQIYLDTISCFFRDGETVDLDALKRKKLVAADVTRLEVLARGSLDKPLVVKAHEISPTAVKMLVLTGGKAVKLCG